jgi:hypothetical protein
MYDGRVEFVFVSEMFLVIAAGGECLWTKRAAVLSRKLAEELVEVEVVGCGGGEATAVAAEDREITVVHARSIG